MRRKFEAERRIPQGRLCRPEDHKERGPRRAVARWGKSAKARYEHLLKLIELYK